MSVLEVKGEMHELISSVKSPSAAEILLRIIRDFVKSQPEIESLEDDFERNMDEESVNLISASIEMSYDPQNLIPHEAAKQKLESWLSLNKSNG